MGERNDIFDGLLVNDRLASLSENDSGKIGEESSVDPVEQPPEDEETTGGIEQKPGDDTFDQGKEDKEDIPGSDPAEQEQTTAIIEDSDLQPRYEDIMERLDLLDMQEDPTDLTPLTESIRSLVDLMSMDQYQQRDVYTPPEILIEGYQDWDYPITVDYLISIVGYEDYLPQSATYDDHEQFLEDFQDLAWNCFQGTVFKDFYIDKVYDAGGEKVYDSQPETEPEPGEEEPGEAVELLLSHLENIDATLAEMQQADLEYYQAVYDYQEEMLQINAAETASTIFICVTVIAIFAAILWSELFRRFK